MAEEGETEETALFSAGSRLTFQPVITEYRITVRSPTQRIPSAIVTIFFAKRITPSHWSLVIIWQIFLLFSIFSLYQNFRRGATERNARKSGGTGAFCALKGHGESDIMKREKKDL